jgi:anaerobic dimethyl sulfoxide reductase subunit A
MRKAIEPMYECRDDLDILTELAQRVGIKGYNLHTEEEWLRDFTNGAIDDFDAFREQGVARLPKPDDAVAFAAQIRDPENHKFSTPSGKIEVYSTALGENPDPYGLGPISPIPTWVPHAEFAPDSPYPLQVCSSKSRARTHSIHGNQPKLGKVDPDDLWIHPNDAAPRGIEDGDRVRVLSAHGATLLPARVTDEIAPGVVSMKDGAWFSPDTDGTDTKGCPNAVTADTTSPAGAMTYNTNFVQVDLAEKG